MESVQEELSERNKTPDGDGKRVASIIQQLLSNSTKSFPKRDYDREVCRGVREAMMKAYMSWLENHNSNNGMIIGIDFGTTDSCVSVFKNGQAEIIVDDRGNRFLPSYVAFTPDGGRLIGEEAKDQLEANPENTVYDVKRMIGRHWDDPYIQRGVKLWPFRVINKNNKPYVEVTVGKEIEQFAPEEIAAMIFGKLKDIAELHLGEKIRHAVITGPASFNNAQRQATKDAFKIAGLNVVRLLNEPTAAAIAYSLDNTGKKNVLVSNLDGGFFDVSLLTIDNGKVKVLATNGDTRLGSEKSNKNFSLLTLECVKRVLKDSQMRKEDVQEIVMVGGCAQIPKIQQLWKDFFNGKEPKNMNRETVAYGAAVQAGAITGEKGVPDLVALDVNPLTLGVNIKGGIMSPLIPRNTVIPTTKSKIYTTIYDNQEAVSVWVYEGERPMTKDNRLLGGFELTGIPRAPREVPEVDVTFEIDVNGILHVSAKVKATGHKVQINITNDNRQNSEGVENMVQDAEKYADDDKKAVKLAYAWRDTKYFAYLLKDRLVNGKENVKCSSDFNAINDAVAAKINWFKFSNLDGTADELEKQKKELEDLKSKIDQLYQNSG